MDVLQAFESVVKQDDASGHEFIGQVVYDFMADLAELNRDEISKALAVWSLDRVQVAKRHLAKSYVESTVSGQYPDDRVFTVASWLAGIEQFVAAAVDPSVSKALGMEQWSVNGRLTNRRVNRDASGRFARGVSQGEPRLSLSEFASADGRRARHLNRSVKDYQRSQQLLGPDERKSREDELARAQSQWEEASQIAQEMKSIYSAAGAKNTDGVDVALTLLAPDGRMRVVRTPLSEVKPVNEGGIFRNYEETLAPTVKESILSVELMPSTSASKETAARVAAFNTLGGAGGSALASLAFTDPQLYRSLSDSLKLPDRGTDEGFLSRLFGVLESGGRVLEGVNGAERLGQAANLVGVLGPQAQEVLGPYVQRAAYRYRGTETTPSVSLRQALASPDMQFVQAIANDQVSPETVKNVKGTPMVRDALRWKAEGVRGDSLVRQVQADEVSVALAQTLPDDPFLSTLSAASGQVLPSQGIILDSQGRVVSQSVGFTDDHYLPFDLRNLGRLRGGQYVRTRQLGGLTGEDVYTAVMTGARQVQVVSRSGVFTLEFAPDFRGARGNSDKAYSMYNRYLRILDAVDSSNLYLEDVDPARQAELRERSRMLTRGKGEADQRAKFEELLQEERDSRGTVTPTKVKEIQSEVLRDMGVSRLGDEPDDAVIARLRGADRRQFNDTVDERVEAFTSDRANKLRLNAQGYEKALQVLQQQFPYFIKRVSYQPLNSLPGTDRRSVPKEKPFTSDAGYVQPGSLRSRNVRSGFMNPGQVQPERNRSRGSGEQLALPGVDAAPAAPAASSSKPSSESSAPQESFADAGVAAETKSIAANLDKRIDKQVDSIVNDFSGLSGFTLDKMAILERDFDAVKSNKVNTVMWLLQHQDPKAVQEAVKNPANTDAVLSAISDPSVVRQAVDNIVSANSVVDDPFGSAPAGAKNKTELLQIAASRLMDLGDVVALRQPFGPAVESVKDPAEYREMAPMAFPEMRDISSASQFADYVAAHPDEYDLAFSIVQDGPDMLADLPQIRIQAVDRLDSVQALKDSRESFQRTLARNPDAKLDTYVDSREWSDVFPGVELTVDSLLDADLDEAALRVQRAWSLAVVGKLLDVALREGDVFAPKDQRLLFKAASKVKTVLTVLDRKHPFAKALARKNRRQEASTSLG